MQHIRFSAEFAGYSALSEAFNDTSSGFMIKKTPERFPFDFREIIDQVVRQRKEIEEMFTKIKSIEACDVEMSFERKDKEIMDDLIESGVISEDEFI